MATIVLGAVGAAIGSGFGGAVLGLSGAVIGRAVGATLGRVIDQRLLGSGSEVVDGPRLDRLRLTGAGEGGAVPQVWGRMRIGGQVIWASRFLEQVSTRRVGGGGKGAPSTRVRDYSYSISLAVALCEGEIAGVGRIWADGEEIARDTLEMRVYRGGEGQLPDPKIEAVEGAGQVPAYRGIAYVVFEDLDLGRFGNRVPQFTFEVMRPASAGPAPDLSQGVRAVALMPGTGEYALATTPVTLRYGLPGAEAPVPAGLGEAATINANTASGRSDMALSVEALGTELPNCGSVALVVSWFGDDLRCGMCSLRPKVESRDHDAAEMPWRVSGLARAGAEEIAKLDGRPVYGGTPTDQSVIEAIIALREAGQAVLFYPFILMEQMAGNTLLDPWTGAEGQPVLPWRGRITASVAPGREGSPDRSAAVEAEVAAFFGTAQPGDFALSGGEVVYAGPDEWSYRRFILHYAWLAKAAGGVGAFCVGSEMRGLTQLRGAADSFPVVAALRALAADVRGILGPEVKISYAADWSEYFGYQSPEGNRYFHLDPFWADENVDFIGIDNYMPLSDWRDGEGHLDAHWGAIYCLDYLKANVAGGEGYDWYYASQADRDAQRRTPINDGAYGEHWVWRYKDLRGWWENLHHDRIDGARVEEPTAWVPRSKPFWFTELGCAAIDKGTNEPNKFLDPKSSESRLPVYSDGRRDDLIQLQYHRAMIAYWGGPANNPESDLYAGPMVDMARAHVWAWDARPFPHFPALEELWSDGGNWARGHWITGRSAAQPLDNVVAEICARAGVAHYDVSGLHGLVRGYAANSMETGRGKLQGLMLAHGFEAVERGGVLRFVKRDGREAGAVPAGELVARGEGGALELVRAPQAEVAGRVRLLHVEAEADFDIRAIEAVFPDEDTVSVAQSELPMVFLRSEARGIVERWLAEARVARDTARFALPPSSPLGAGDVVALGAGAQRRLWRIDRLDLGEAREAEALRVEPGLYRRADQGGDRVALRPFQPPVPVFPVFLDLPLMTGDEVAHAPHLAVTASPWPGSVAVFEAAAGGDFTLNGVIERRAAIGVSETALVRARPGRWDRGPALRVRMSGAALVSRSMGEVLQGANLMAIGDGSSGNWELFQFAEAEMVGLDRYDLRLRLRGQLGSDAAMPDLWRPGSIVVRVDAALAQVALPASARGLARSYRIGPALRPLDDASYVERSEAFAGIGLRPYAPVHLRARRVPGGPLDVAWLRRTRIDGDSWEGVDVPLGEESERYLLRVLSGQAVLREVDLSAPFWSYGAALQASDGAVAPFRIAVAQVSQRFGAGPFTEIEIDE
ncbi:baseplate multidomain protein megatron [Alkalilacustris brevis]|uniref:baseplate multidomain protein megatron n=1 Tax=Alkalilacustris brevis TaxID=2026338 RepID=UPI000E0D8A67|nr:glycoside hydrolase/phage tail family protein [Alkalilacustris brevis]